MGTSTGQEEWGGRSMGSEELRELSKITTKDLRASLRKANPDSKAFIEAEDYGDQEKPTARKRGSS